MSDSSSSTTPDPATPEGGNSGQIVVYSTAWCGDCRRARSVFAALGVPYQNIDIEEHPEAAQIVRELNHGMQSVPTIVFPDGSMLVEPGSRELEEKLRRLA